MTTRPAIRRSVPEGRRRPRPRPSTPSIVAAILGGVLLVLGIVALTRAGLAQGFTEPAVTVGPFSRTPLFALIELVLGMVGLATAADADVRSAVILAVLTGVAGIVWLIEPGAFQAALGVTAATGWLYVLFSAALLAAVAATQRPRQGRAARPR